MAKTDITRQKIKSKISAIKKINDKPRSIIDNSYDAYKDDLESTNGIVKKGITSFTSKVKGTTQNKKDIFGEILDISDGFSSYDKNTSLTKEKIIKYSKESASKALQSSKQIIIDETKKSFFGGTGICNINTTIDDISLSPKSFDIMNILKVDPSTLTGKLMYENPVDLGFGDVKFNTKLYEQFADGKPAYPFTKKDSGNLFFLEWNSGTQMYDITFTGTTKAGGFLDDYYNTIEHPDIAYVMMNAMQMTLQGDGTEPSAFKDGMKNVNRLCTKLLSVCGSPATDPLLNNTPQQVTEDETDVEDYFDFDDIEGIDLDDEDAKLRNVLKFRDCSNFEIPINTNHMEDFGYLLDKKTIDENITNTINKAASDAYEQSDGSINLDAFKLSLNTSFISNIPKALISSALSPKMIFPIAVVYQDLKGGGLTAKDLMKKMSNLFYNIVKNVFWNFIKEFWRYIRKDLLNFVKDTASQIILNKTKKVKGIVSSLINILTQTLQTNIGSCTEIFNAILSEITSAMNKKVNVPIPGLLLSISDRLPGYSTDRAYMNVIERMESSGINTGPIYGTENKFPSVIKAILDGHGEEMDSNSYVKIGMKLTTIPANGTNAYITPLVVGAGKIF